MTTRLLGRYDYPTPFRLVELSGTVTFAVAVVVLVVKVVGDGLDRPTAFALRLLGFGFAAFVLTDFLSGLVHFLCDTYGSPDTPIVGQKFIKSFRDHHDTPMRMTQDDFVAVNADNLILSLPVLVYFAWWVDVEAHRHWSVFVLALVAFVAITNQAHKWAHMPTRPALVRLLQRSGFVLSNDRHARHHRGAFDTSYCITSGLLNPLFDRIGLWQLLSR